MPESVRVPSEVGAQRLLDHPDRIAGSGDRYQSAEVPRCERDDHEVGAAGGDEIGSVRAVYSVPEGLPLGAADLHLGEVAQRARGGECDIVQRKRDMHTRTGVLASAHGGSVRERGV